MLNSQDTEHFHNCRKFYWIALICIFEVKLCDLGNYCATLPQATHLIKFFIKLAELGHFLHDLLPHEKGSVNGGIAPTSQGAKGILDERLLQEYQDPLEEQRCNTVIGLCYHHGQLLEFTQATGGTKEASKDCEP